MRLIDADALMRIYEGHEFCSDMGDAMEILNNAPTIEAIPVEWIEQQIAEFRESKTFYISGILMALLYYWEIERKEE